LAEELAEYLSENETWPYNKHLESRVRTEIYKRLLPLVQPFDPNRARDVVDNVLKMQRITS